MPTENTPTNPWGEDFDAETAWNLVTTLRNENKGLKTERTALKATEAELTAERDAALTAKDADGAGLTSLQRELWVERALRKHPDINEEYIEFLSGEDEDSILAKAAKLAKLSTGTKTDPAPDPEADPDKVDPDAAALDATGRPAPALTPGHGGNDPEVLDLAAIATAARAAR